MQSFSWENRGFVTVLYNRGRGRFSFFIVVLRNVIFSSRTVHGPRCHESRVMVITMRSLLSVVVFLSVHAFFFLVA